MAIRIDKIKLNRGGPLGSDFELEPGDLNLIYGHNETGKTYIVETMINLLFRTGSRSPAKWNLRVWDHGGRIIVSGLEDDPVRFTKTGRKLEDYWEEGPGLPRDLSRLLVVKGGEAVLAEEEEDGVGRGILKNYLSGEGLLDKIAARISTTLQDATVQEHLIHGAQRGEVKTRIQCKKRLDSLNALLKDVEEGYASGEVYSLRQKKEVIKAELKKLEKAKRYHAAQLHKMIQDLRRKKDELPVEEELSELEADVRIHNSKMAEAKTKSGTLKELDGTSEDYRWAEKALADYSEMISEQAVSAPKPMLILLALLFFASAVASGFFGHKIALLICGIVSLVFFILNYGVMWDALARSGMSTELENLKADFSTRFGFELTNRAVLQSQLDKLKENHIRATSLREEVNKLNVEIKSRKDRITETLKSFTGAERPPQQWGSLIRKFRNIIRKLEDNIRSLDAKLLSLAVPEEEYLDKHPGTEWDAERYENLEDELKRTEEVLDGKMKKLELLKTRIAQETGSESTEWENLINDLRNMLEEGAEKYREITAEILAKIQVKTGIQEFREEENITIADGLKRQELTKPLHALTGRYNRIIQGEDSGLILMTDGEEEYPLADISTGAREQIYLALRMGFASIAMGGQTAFLVLDDAFQHSDWDRRKNIIVHTLSLVKNGWQVFYFAMDDHIRDLFLEEGRALGDRFRSLELC
jgi:uncharacterized protein YhaN